MFKKVLLCYDGTEAGRRALRRGAELAIELRADVHILSILPADAEDPVILAGAMGSVCVAPSLPPSFQAMLDESVEKLKSKGVLATGHLATGNTIEQILRYTKRLGIDLIVLGHYPQPTGGFWWNRSSSKISLAERANCCVFVAIDPPQASVASPGAAARTPAGVS